MKRRTVIIGTSIFFAGCSSNSDPKEGETPENTYTPRPDSDGDGTIDAVDAFPNDPQRDTDSDGDGVADEDDVKPFVESVSEQTVNISEDVEIGSGDYTVVEVQLDSEGRIEYSYIVISGTQVNAFVVDESGYETYMAGNSPETVENLSSSGSEAVEKQDVPPGMYYVIFENASGASGQEDEAEDSVQVFYEVSGYQ